MLQPAIKYEQQLKELYINIALEDDFKFMFSTSYRDDLEVSKSTWNTHQFVSVNQHNEVVGYFKYSIDRDSMSCYGLQIVNFKKDKLCRVFANDLKQLFQDIFFRFNFRKLKFGVHIGNPAEKFYDKYIDSIGGRIVGINKEDDRLIDGKYYDYKTYEILQRDFKTV
jgi:hypothetical protein